MHSQLVFINRSSEEVLATCTITHDPVDNSTQRFTLAHGGCHHLQGMSSTTLTYIYCISIAWCFVFHTNLSKVLDCITLKITLCICVLTSVQRVKMTRVMQLGCFTLPWRPALSLHLVSFRLHIWPWLLSCMASVSWWIFASQRPFLGL